MWACALMVLLPHELSAQKPANPVVVMETNVGTITLELFQDKAPKTVENFLTYAKAGFYNGTIFHRVIKDFMVQGGDPEGTGSGGPGYTFEDEFNDHKIVRGALAMANAGPNTNGSQFFIVTTDAAPWLDGKHTVFGEVTEGMDVIEKIGKTKTVKPGDKPVTPIVIKTVTIERKAGKFEPEKLKDTYREKLKELIAAKVAGRDRVTDNRDGAFVATTWKPTDAITTDTSRNDLLKIAIGGLVSGLITPLLPDLIDKLAPAPATLRLALVALPFAALVFVVVRRRSANPMWAALLAVVITMVAFVAAVNAAIFVDGQMAGAAKAMRSLFAGLAGGFVGSGLMALGIALLPAGPRKAEPWLPMLVGD
jgi:cyclophilin family peptidyl-prolyl cis-trans isomerase